MKKHVLAFGTEFTPDQLATLRGSFEVTWIAKPDEEKEAFAAALLRAHGIIGGRRVMERIPLDPATTPRLEALATLSVGHDRFDFATLKTRGIVLTNTSTAAAESTADLGFALLMAAARRIAELDAWVRRGEWKKSVGEAHFGTSLHGKRLGLVGFGQIGQAIGRRGRHGFGMEILYHSRRPNQAAARPLDAAWVPLDTLLAEADFLCVALALTPETRHFLGRREFSLVRPGAILVNISRGETLDEAALIDALRENRLRAAALDVYETEPLPADSPLMTMANVVLSPHMGTSTHETRRAMADEGIVELTAALSGRRPSRLVNAEVWEARKT
ncbi:gluconate 2-dehydrogenase [Verrucomicrobium sp. GAS474]|uniref:2-hydroxyacid dehydrogenase n=1 Tax=Verrucomicrobium sp. GAS474 TaxID=1882831 RepID=UPI00087A7274|nr:D-glycerate dehydrogenase [Verrucomicrobium sp. GAS474]SDU03281.1 gluconate 2-dehydrogenase [Verrucomicrobium sp. GAS474]